MKMVPVFIAYEDGQYSMLRTDSEDWRSMLPTHIEIPETIWEAYSYFCLQTHLWHRVISKLDNQAIEDEREAQP